ncbi:hypothetical protein [Microbulbifer elongatus]|uniref:hypothetical protein n=1 Tax=Microbulbifer elongatus TaxID=86173 RepID=UPI001E567FBD|nr:hypothetical protein [Microbulbifer elongatus]
MQRHQSSRDQTTKARTLPAAPLFSRRFVVVTLALTLAVALCVQPLGLQAQSSSEDSKPQAQSDKSEQATENTTPVAVKQEVKTPAKKTQPSIKAQSARRADSYEATEEISEDLSVSYPVDI